MNILLTSAGRRSYLVKYFKEALQGDGKVYVGNSDENVSSFLYADEKVITPCIYDNNYIDFLLKYCLEKDIVAIIPLFDIDLYILSMHKELFKSKGVHIIVSDVSVVSVCNDKWRMHDYLEKNQISTPKVYISLESAIEALRNYKLEFPLMIKPRWGMGSIGIYEVNRMEELEILYFRVKRQIDQTYLRFESRQDIDQCVLIQEKIIGQEYGIDIINDLDGIYQSTIVKKKCAMRAGETDIAVTTENEIIENIGRLLGGKLEHIGNLDVDIILSDKGEPYVIDMNARFGGGYPFSHCAGVNLPKAIIAWLKGKTIRKDILIPDYNVMSYKNIEIVKKDESDLVK